MIEINTNQKISLATVYNTIHAFEKKDYLKDIKKFRHKKLIPIPDFDVLAYNPETTAGIVKTQLKSEGIKNVTIKNISFGAQI